MRGIHVDNPVIEINGSIGKYDGTCYKIEVVGDVTRIEYKLESLTDESDLTAMIENATNIAKQIKTLVAL